MSARGLALAAALLGAAPAAASTYVEVEKICPIGGEKFTFMELMSISTFGQLPDGMPVGSGTFPIQLPQCPGNGAVIYAELDKAKWAKLTPYVASAGYRALRATETRYFLAYKLADAAGDTKRAPWLLLSATWEAKNAGNAAQARRYAEAYVTLVGKLPADDSALESIALRARAANALRELGRFDEAETLRASIKVAASVDEGERNGWNDYLAALTGTIARRETARAPIDLLSNSEAAARCLAPEFADKGEKVLPLDAFETRYCAGPKLAEDIAEIRKDRE